MGTYLTRLIDYNNWANARLIAFLAEMPGDTLDRSAAGVYGTIGTTLEHLLMSEISYHRRLIGEATPAHPNRMHIDGEYLTMLARESVGGLADIVDTLPPPDRMIALHDGNRAAATMLTQLFMHGVEHRSHVGTILGANGIEPPDIDAWAHGILAAGDDWPGDWGPGHTAGDQYGIAPDPSDYSATGSLRASGTSR